MQENNSHRNNQQTKNELVNETDVQQNNVRVGMKIKNTVQQRIKYFLNLLKDKLISLWQRISSMSKRNKIIVVVIGVLAIVVAILVVVIPGGNVASNSAANMIQHNIQQQRLVQLNHIESQLGVLTSELNQSSSPSAQQLNQIVTRLHKIQSTVGGLATQSGMDHLSHMVRSGDKNLSGKISNMLLLVQQIKKQITPVTYLKASVLPFKPVSVDIWNGVSYVTVKLDGHSALMGKNETRGSWTVKSLDYDAQKVVFENHKRQFVRVYIEN